MQAFVYGKLGREGTVGGALGGPQPPFIFRMVRAFLTRRVFLRTILVFLGIIYYKKTIIYNFIFIKTQDGLKAFSNYVFFAKIIHAKLKTLVLNNQTKTNYHRYVSKRDFQTIHLHF
jgi:hypothetical protein